MGVYTTKCQGASLSDLMLLSTIHVESAVSGTEWIAMHRNECSKQILSNDVQYMRKINLDFNSLHNMMIYVPPTRAVHSYIVFS